MRRLYLLTLLCIALTLAACDAGLTGTSADGEAALMGPDKVEICHYDKEDDQYVLTEVPEVALAGHEKHGDGEVGDPIPDMVGFIFDETCTPEEDVVACMYGDTPIYQGPLCNFEYIPVSEESSPVDCVQACVDLCGFGGLIFDNSSPRIRCL